MTVDTPGHRDLSRPLANAEQYMKYRSAEKLYTNFQVWCNLNHAPTPLLLYQALRKVIIDYPMFATNTFDLPIDAEGKLPAVVAVVRQPVPTSLVLEDIRDRNPGLGVDVERNHLGQLVPTEKWLREGNEVHFPLNREDRLHFKVVMVSPTSISTMFEHVYADGTNLNFFYSALVKSLAYVEDHPDEWLLRYGYPCPVTEGVLPPVLFNWEHDRGRITVDLPPAIDDYLPDINADYAYGADCANGEAAYDKIIPTAPDKQPYTKWPGRFPNALEINLWFKVVLFTPEETRAVLAKCKAHGVLFTAFACVVHGLTVTPVVGEFYSTTRIAINMRRHVYGREPELFAEDDPARFYLANPDYAWIGSFAHAGLAENMGPVREFSWDECRRVYRNLGVAGKNDRLFNSGAKFVNMTHEEKVKTFYAPVGGPRPDTTKLSNLGYLDVGTQGLRGWEIDNLVFCQDQWMLGADFQFNMILCKNGGLQFVWSIDERQAEDLVGLPEQLRRNILECGKD